MSAAAALEAALLDYLAPLQDKGYHNLSPAERAIMDLAQGLFARVKRLERNGAAEDESAREPALADQLHALAGLDERGALRDVLSPENRGALRSVLGGLVKTGLATSALRKQDAANYLADQAETDMHEAAAGLLEKKRGR